MSGIQSRPSALSTYASTEDLSAPKTDDNQADATELQNEQTVNAAENNEPLAHVALSDPSQAIPHSEADMAKQSITNSTEENNEDTTINKADLLLRKENELKKLSEQHSRTLSTITRNQVKQAKQAKQGKQANPSLILKLQTQARLTESKMVRLQTEINRLKQ